MKSKKTIIIIISILSVLTLSAVGFYWYTHPTFYLYEDRWIIGKTPEQIEQRYGSYDCAWGTLIKGYCINAAEPENKHWGDIHWPKYYMIYFDENGKAYKIQVEEGGWGG